MSNAKYPVEDMGGESDKPCLLVKCPNAQLAVKLFQHTAQHLGEIKAEETINSLIDQGISDQTVSVFYTVCIEEHSIE